MSRFQGKTVVITGASSGIGEACARKFVKEGARVVLAARSKDPLDKLAAELGGDVAQAVPTDISDIAACERLLQEAVSRFGSIDVLVNNAAHNCRGPYDSIPIDDILQMLRHQAKQGVDYFTIHAGVRFGHLKFVQDRLIGIVSRGGSLLAKWMITHNKENPTYTLWEDICDIMREHDVTFSIGDGLRPGGLADATDRAQLAELETLGELTECAWRRGVQVMIEGPGHVSFDQIEYNMKLQRTLCHGAPFYVLGPLVTDIFPGYDHITSCIGATAAAYHGASMLCYVTPKEHLGLPKKDDVKQGCVAYRIAAHAADVALGIPGSRDRDDELTKARAALNWDKHFELSFDPDLARALHDEDLDVDTDFCAMCGHDWCSVRISKEITLFVSGKDERFQWDRAKVSEALSPEQVQILQQRGVLSPDEIHRLAAKTKGAVRAEEGKAACHSDVADDEVIELPVAVGAAVVVAAGLFTLWRERQNA